MDDDMFSGIRDAKFTGADLLLPETQAMPPQPEEVPSTKVVGAQPAPPKSTVVMLLFCILVLCIVFALYSYMKQKQPVYAGRVLPGIADNTVLPNVVGTTAVEPIQATPMRKLHAAVQSNAKKLVSTPVHKVQEPAWKAVMEKEDIVQISGSIPTWEEDYVQEKSERIAENDPKVLAMLQEREAMDKLRNPVHHAP